MDFQTQIQKRFFYSFPTFLFSILPLSLITGPFLSDLSISLIGIVFLTYCSFKKNFLYFKNKFFILFCILWLYLLLNSFFNNVNFDSIKISVSYIRFGIFTVAVIALLRFDDKFLKHFFYCLFFCFFLLILDGFFQYFFDQNIFGYAKASNSRVSSFFGDELILGSYLSRLWPIFFCLSIFFYKGSNKFIVFIFFFILAEVLIFLSGERTAFFYINLSTIFVLLLSQKLKKLRFLTLVFSLLLIIIISFFNTSAKKRIVDQTFNQFRHPTIENKIYIFSEQHTHHYLTAYKMFLDNKLFGVGVKNFRKFCNNENYRISELSCSTHPHNTYIQMLSETGIFGFIILLLIFLIFNYYIFKHIRLRIKNNFYFNDFEICILSGILITIWPFAPTGNIFNNWLSIIYYLYIPFLVWCNEKGYIRQKLL